MKRFLIFLTVAIVPASAQWRHFGGRGGGPTEVTGFAGIGFSAPANPIANQLNTGFNLSGGIGITQPYAGVLFEGMFNNFGLNDATLAQFGARHGSQKYWAFTIDPIVHVNPRGPVDFYVTGGGGIYGQNTKLKSAISSPQGFDLTSSDTQYGPGVNGGAGFSFSLDPRSRAKFFMEARYHHMFVRGRDADFIPVTVGVRF